jgi:hypothetical protein
MRIGSQQTAFKGSLTFKSPEVSRFFNEAAENSLRGKLKKSKYDLEIDTYKGTNGRQGLSYKISDNGAAVEWKDNYPVNRNWREEDSEGIVERINKILKKIGPEGSLSDFLTKLFIK